ncbi:hypothetical protein DRJ04_06730 [Candidatus Aerophobetes bacterium]|uniref:Uncharacterized protein n=1 Tax=Aerophobetes bacterium TaxID=2030807 RepID=A0A662D8P7_UNCAE|nr:MAG: hypothetical protein DRJ04_06730 [Candidatus Aerophobetes bacterium]
MSKWIAGILIMAVVLVGGAAWALPHPIPGPSIPPPNSTEVQAWELSGTTWISMGGAEAKARCFSSEQEQGSCNKQTWEIPVKVHASVTQWVEWNLSGTQWTWFVRKPGTYAADCITATLKSNYDVDIIFDGFENLKAEGESVNPYIPIYYAYGPEENGGPPPREAFIPAEELNGLDCLVPDSERLHEGYFWKLWNYIEVCECNSACEYQDDATITVELKGVKQWIEPETGIYMDYVG